jgi:Zn-finger nucleic acid-binding protein
MDCPKCGETLQSREKFDADVYSCPECQGIWLKRGQLDEIIDSAQSGSRSTTKPKKKKGGFMGNLMDSFGGGGDD